MNSVAHIAVTPLGREWEGHLIVHVFKMDNTIFHCLVELDIIMWQCCPFFLLGEVQIRLFLDCLWCNLFLNHSLWDHISLEGCWSRWILLHILLSPLWEENRGPLMSHPRSECTTYGSDSSLWIISLYWDSISIFRNLSPYLSHGVDLSMLYLLEECWAVI